jgi:hypothetical protein
MLRPAADPAFSHLPNRLLAGPFANRSRPVGTALGSQQHAESRSARPSWRAAQMSWQGSARELPGNRPVGIPATIPNAMDGEASRADAPPASLCITFSKRGSRLTLPIAIFEKSRPLGATLEATNRTGARNKHLAEWGGAMQPSLIRPREAGGRVLSLPCTSPPAKAS